MQSGFRVHLAWHLALYQLDVDAPDTALSTYDDLICPQLDGGNNGLVDASSLLWRLQRRGNGSQRRWREITAHWLRRRTLGNRAFELVHAVMALAVAAAHAGPGGSEAAEERSDAPRRSGHDELALAQPLTPAIMSFYRGNYEGAVASISAIRTAADRCGGSVAQCDLIHLTLLEAALRAQQTRRARTPANERAARKPGGRLNRWLKARAWTLGKPRRAARQLLDGTRWLIASSLRPRCIKT